MHDKNGKEIHVDDFVRLTTYINGEQKQVVAQVLSVKPGSDSCDVYVGVPYRSLVIRQEYATAKDVECV